MADDKKSCPQMPSCRMYAVFTLASTVQIWKDNYCVADFERCARYQGAACGNDVPDLLLPNGKLLKKIA